MRRGTRYAVLLAVLAAIAATPAGAVSEDKKKELGKFGVWRAFAYEEGGQTVCYMVTAKTDKAKANTKGRISYLMITHRPVEGSVDVFSYGAGKALDAKHGAVLRIDKDSYELFSVTENAWARDAITDHKIAKAIRETPTLRIIGIPAQGRATMIDDKFTLTGALPAYRAIGKACGLPDIAPPKPAVKKAVAKKPAIKKPEIRKPATKKPVAVKTTVKKPVVTKKTTIKSKTSK